MYDVNKFNFEEMDITKTKLIDKTNEVDFSKISFEKMNDVFKRTEMCKDKDISNGLKMHFVGEDENDDIRIFILELTDDKEIKFYKSKEIVD